MLFWAANVIASEVKDSEKRSQISDFSNAQKLECARVQNLTLDLSVADCSKPSVVPVC